MKKFTIILSVILGLWSFSGHAASVVATANQNPITDSDITARVKLMILQGKKTTDNRKQALNNIINDYVKLSYAEQFKMTPSDAEVKKQIKHMQDNGLNIDGIDSTTRAMMNFAVRADIAWQMIIGRTILPMVDVDQSEIDAELAELERTHGLPVNITMVRLVDIPKSIADKLTKPKSCDDAMQMAKNMGGEPQKITAVEYELDESVRKRIAGLPIMQWSNRVDNSVLLVCSKTKNKEYGKLDDIIKQNAMYKKAIFTGEQQLKQLRRKAVIVINDARYK